MGDAIARVLEAAGAEVTREFYINDRGNQMRPLRPPRSRPRHGPGGARRRLPRRLHPRARPEDRGRHPGDPGPAGRRADGRLPRGRLRPSARGAAQAARRVPHPHRRLVLRAVPPRQRGRRVGPGEAARRGPPVRRGRRALDADHRLRRRQGPGADPLQRRADLLRQRHGVLRQQAGARLRPVALPPRRRPPRVRRPVARDGRLHRRRPGADPRGPDRPDGQDHARTARR